MLSKLTQTLLRTSTVWFNRIFSSLHIVIFFTALLLLSLANQLPENIQTNGETWRNLRVFLMTLCVGAAFFSLMIFIATLTTENTELANFKKQLILMSLISFNLILFCYNLALNELNSRKRLSLNRSKRKKWRFHLHRLTTFDITLIAVFSGLVVLGNWLEMTIHFLSYGAGGLNIKYMFVIIIACLNSVVSGFFTGMVGSLISLLFLGNGLVISPWSYLLDYLLPTVSPCIAGFFYSPVVSEKRTLQYINYVLMTVTSYLLIWLWQTLSGYLIWVKLYPPAWGSAGNGFVYSLVFNALSIWVFSYPLTQILTPPIIRCLGVLSWKH